METFNIAKRRSTEKRERTGLKVVSHTKIYLLGRGDAPA